MKILVVEDSLYKLAEEETILRRLGLNEYICCSCVMDAMKQIANGDIDLMIVDLGLPLQSNELVENSLEGMLMLQRLAYQDVLVPTLVYSTTDIPKEAIKELAEFDFPFLGQARDRITLKVLLQKYLENLQKADDDKIAQSEENKTVGAIMPWNDEPNLTIKDKLPSIRKRGNPRLR